MTKVNKCKEAEKKNNHYGNSDTKKEEVASQQRNACSKRNMQQEVVVYSTYLHTIDHINLCNNSSASYYLLERK